MVTKRYASDTLRIKDVIDQDIYEYDTFKSEFHWQLCDSTKNINGFEAYKAIMAGNGRFGSRPTFPLATGLGCSAVSPGLFSKHATRITCLPSA